MILPTLNPNKKIHDVRAIRHHIKETFEKTLQSNAKIFPGAGGQIILQHDNKDLYIQIVKDLNHYHRKFYGTNPKTTLKGFAVFEDWGGRAYVEFDEPSWTFGMIGHELGHILTPQLIDYTNEEAKAYAFQCAFTQTIEKQNIGGLSKLIQETNEVPDEEEYPTHHKGFRFVIEQLKKGYSPLELYWLIANSKKQVPLYFTPSQLDTVQTS